MDNVRARPLLHRRWKGGGFESIRRDVGRKSKAILNSRAMSKAEFVEGLQGVTEIATLLHHMLFKGTCGCNGASVSTFCHKSLRLNHVQRFQRVRNCYSVDFGLGKINREGG
jgi:hypothetical protein